MASPHIAGATALLARTSKSPLEIKTILELKTIEGANWIDDSGDGIQEPLLDISSTLFIPILLAVNNVNENVLPTAQFTVDCTNLSCSFDASTSSDNDGSIASYQWDFGDGQANTGETTSHVFGVDGTYTTVLTVTDNEGATASLSQGITVQEATYQECGLMVNPALDKSCVKKMALRKNKLASLLQPVMEA